MEVLNDKADAMCHKMQDLAQNSDTAVTTISTFFPSQKISVRNKYRRFVTEKPSQYNKDQHYDKLKLYMMERNVLSEDLFQKISWPAIDQLYKKIKRHEQITYTKVIHEKWITLYQQKINGNHPTGICALCKGPEETQKHVYECSHCQQTQFKTTLAQAFVYRLNQRGTPTCLSYLLAQGFDPHTNTSAMLERAIDMSPHNLKSLVEEVILEQSQIGWDCYRKGLISKKWATLMDTYMSQL